MTEAQWLAGDNLRTMIDFLESHFQSVYQKAAALEEEQDEDFDRHPEVRAINRKYRLFAVACCRHVGHLLTDEQRAALAWMERYVDGLAPEDERSEMATAATGDPKKQGYPQQKAAEAAYRAVDDIQDDATDARETAELAAEALASTVDPDGDGDFELYARTKQAGVAVQVQLLRDVFAPFHSAAVDPGWLAWNGGTLRQLAQAIYEERAFERLPILADALEEAGCTDAAILSHCRQPGEHVRGCWVVDLILGMG